MPHGALTLRAFSGGLTLIELVGALAVVGVLIALAWPFQQAQIQRARRLDAIAALTRLQIAQEQYRTRHGRYAADLAALPGAGSARSPEGLYQLALDGADGETVTLVASPSAGSPQEADRPCVRITMRLNQGGAEPGPDPRCWNR